MKKQLFISIGLIILFLFVSCEEYYKPVLDTVQGTIVIESHMTNDQNQNFVRLSMTRNFYSTDAVVWITGARIDLIEVGGNTNRATENGLGYYVFSIIPIAGRKYILRVAYQRDVFESDVVVMPPAPSIDSLYTNHTVEKNYLTDSYGVPSSRETPGREICINAAIKPTLEYYRFYWRAILEWQYNPPSLFGPPPPSWYGWLSRYENAEFNLAGPKQFSVSNQVKNHPILFLNYDENAYLDSVTQTAIGWIVIIDQYGITKNSFDFHDKLNKQFAAEGSLFDPILTQVFGNFHCKNDPSKIVMGFFDLNSYRQYRYYMNFGIDEKSSVIVHQIDSYPVIPDNGYQIGSYPSFWKTN
jgi:hypothetical protein